METDEGLQTRQPGGVLLALRDPIYRAVFVVMLLQGVATGGSLPFVPLWATSDLGASPVQAGLLQTLAGLVGAVLSFLLGTLSDRSGHRTRWIIGTMSLASASSFALVMVSDFAIACVLYATASAGVFGILFALLGDWLRNRNEVCGAAIHTTVRIGYTLGWAIGPLLAAQVVDLGNYRALFLGMAMVQGGMVCLIKAGVPDPQLTPGDTAHLEAREDGTIAGQGALIAYSAAVFCVSGAVAARYLVMPLYITEQLRLPASTLSQVLLVSAVAQVPMMIAAACLAERWGSVKLLLAGHFITAIHYGAYIACPTYWQIFLLQPIYAAGHSAWNCVGIRYAQDLLPGRAGTAMAYYDSASRLGPIVASPVLGYLITGAGYEVAFAGGAVLAVASLVIFILSARTQQRLTSHEGCSVLEPLPGDPVRRFGLAA